MMQSMSTHVRKLREKYLKNPMSFRFEDMGGQKVQEQGVGCAICLLEDVGEWFRGQFEHSFLGIAAFADVEYCEAFPDSEQSQIYCHLLVLLSMSSLSRKKKLYQTEPKKLHVSIKKKS
jgi:hypothetical protein